MRHWSKLIVSLALFGAASAQALTPAQALAIASGDSDARIAALNSTAASGDPRLPILVQALLDDEVKVAGDKVYIVHEGKASAAATGAEAALPEGSEDVSNNNRMRGALAGVQAVLKLISSDVATRRSAIAELGKASLEEGQLPLVDKALAAETDSGLKEQLQRMRATLLVSSADRAKRLTAAEELATSSESSVASLLQERLAAGGESDPEVRAALQRALEAVRGRLAWGERLT
ncbi:MAG: urea ABC transporter permease subunit UrtB, partial [Pseudomonadota bacterium]|nr:urea ABC transporter permease subunit UrtB [Pseudomonadota bacterium]